jgi:hypothetical protein
MLPPVETDEHLVAHGLYRQVRQGTPTKLQEFWSIHTLPDEASIWRSQWLYEGAMPVSACYLLRDPEFHPVQMVYYRRWHDGREDMIEYRFAPRHMTVLYRDQAQDMILPAGYEVCGWHTVMEHLWWGRYEQQLRGWQTLTCVAPGIHNGTLWPAMLRVDAELQRSEILPGPGGPYSTRVYALEVAGMGSRTVHLDPLGVPLRWAFPEEQLVVELSEYVRQK